MFACGDCLLIVCCLCYIFVFIGLFSCYVCFVTFECLLLVIDCGVLLIVLVYALLIRLFGCFAFGRLQCWL